MSEAAERLIGVGTSASGGSAPARAAYRLERDASYLLWLASDTATGVAGALGTFAVPLIAIAITGSAVQAGLIGGTSMALRLVTTLVGGVLADRRDRFALMIAGAFIGTALGAAFALLDVGGALSFGALFTISAVLAVRQGLFNVAGESAIKQVVPEEAMGRAQAANQARDAAVNLAGGPLGGALLASGAWLVGVGVATGHAVASVTSALLRRRTQQAPVRTGTGAGTAAQPADERSAAPTPLPLLLAARQGLSWLLRRPDLRGVLLVGTVVNLGFNLGVTTLIYSLRLEGYSPQAIGWLTAILSAAMLLAAVASPWLVTRVRAGTLTLVGLALSAAGMVAVGLVESYVATAVILALSVLLVPALNAGLTGYMVVATPSELLGRVTSAGQVLGMGAMPLAPLLAGFGLAWVGRPGTLLVAALLCVGAVVQVLLTPSIRALPAEAGWRAHAVHLNGAEPPGA